MRRSCAALLLAAVLGACASQPASPFFGDDRFLVVGTDPNAEADALARQLEQAGYRVTRTLRGRYFTALGAVDADERPGKVRVLTARGIALALDATPGDPLRPEIRHTLLAPPSRESHDADGDGFEEVFVQIATVDAPPCILVYRVRDSGFVDLVTDGFGLPPQRAAEPPWDAPQFCELETAAEEPEEQSGEPEQPQPPSAPATAPGPAAARAAEAPAPAPDPQPSAVSPEAGSPQAR